MTSEMVVRMIGDRIQRSAVNGQDEARTALIELREDFIKSAFLSRSEALRLSSDKLVPQTSPVKSGSRPCFSGV
jgi:hypothetical protein